jgi:hypothetical protein
MTDRQNDRSTKWQIDKMTDWQNDRSTKWQLDKMTAWQNDRATKWRIDKMTDRQNDRSTKRLIDKMTDRQSDSSTKSPKPAEQIPFSIEIVILLKLVSNCCLQWGTNRTLYIILILGANNRTSEFTKNYIQSSVSRLGRAVIQCRGKYFVLKKH